MLVADTLIEIPQAVTLCVLACIVAAGGVVTSAHHTTLTQHHKREVRKLRKACSSREIEMSQLVKFLPVLYSMYSTLHPRHAAREYVYGFAEWLDATLNNPSANLTEWMSAHRNYGRKGMPELTGIFAHVHPSLFSKARSQMLVNVFHTLDAIALRRMHNRMPTKPDRESARQPHATERVRSTPALQT